MMENLDSGKWILASEAKLRKLMIWPNKVYYSIDGTRFIIILKRSQTNAFSFCVNNIQAFQHIADNVTVRLIEPDGTFITETGIGRIIDEVKGEEPLQSKFTNWGDFFWLTETFKVSRPGEFSKSNSQSAIDYLTGRGK